MELFVYIGFLLGASFFALRKRLIDSESMFFCIYMVAALALSLVVRLRYDFDIQVYTIAMESIDLDFYYLKEPVVWYIQAFLYSLFGSSYYVWILCDMLVFVALFVALRRFGVPQYAFFAIMVYFPFVLGMQNIYRQWVASIFLILSLSFASDRVGRIDGTFKNAFYSFVWFIFAALAHNSAFLFAPVLVVWWRGWFSRMVFVFLLLVILVAYSYIGDSKLSESTGSDLTLLFMLLLAAVLLSFIIMDLKRLLSRKGEAPEVKLALALLYISLVSVIYLESGGAERVAMFSLMLLYPFFSLRIQERFRHGYVIRFLFVVLGFVPILLFSTRQFIIPA